MRVRGPGKMLKVVNRLKSADPVFAELVASSACPPGAVMSLSVDDDLARRLDEVPSETNLHSILPALISWKPRLRLKRGGDDGMTR